MLETLAVNQTFLALGAPLDANELYRLIWCPSDSDQVVLIRIKQTPKGRQAPRRMSRRELQDAIAAGCLKRVDCRPAPETLMTDSDLNASARSKARWLGGAHESEIDCAKVAYRKRWWPILEPVLRELDSVWRGHQSLSQLIDLCSKNVRVGRPLFYLSLYQCLAHGGTRLALFSNGSGKQGGRGVARVGKGKRLGRPPIVQKLSGQIAGNFALSTEDIVTMQSFWQRHVRRDVAVIDAYNRYLDTYWTEHYEQFRSRTVAIHRPPGERPSLMQFRTHGPGNDPQQFATRKQMGEIAWQRQLRPTPGKSTPVTFRAGFKAEIDTSSCDVYLVSTENRSWVIGTAKALPVVDDAFGYISGIYVGWRMNATAVRLAILNAATPKKQFCARYGINIEEDEWTSCLHPHYYADRGEAHCDEVRGNMEAIRVSLEFAKTARPDEHGLVEKTHDLLHLHDLPGSTHGRFRERGDDDPARGATLNIIEFTRLLIERILDHNNTQVVDHLLTSEMWQDGVKPTRVEMLKWAMRKGYHHTHYAHPDEMIASLSPTCDAVVTGRGIYLTGRRYGDSGDEMILERLRYLGDFAIRHSWLESGRRRRFRITVYFNPNLPDTIAYLDAREGLQYFHLVTDDALFQKIASYQDQLISKTHRLQVVTAVKEEARQSRAALAASRRLDVFQAQAELQQLVPLTQKQRRPNDAKGRRDNLGNEVQRTGLFPIPVPTSSEKGVSEEPSNTVMITPIRQSSSPSTDADVAIDAWLRGQSPERPS